jgi:hypothetical protein
MSPDQPCALCDWKGPATAKSREGKDQRHGSVFHTLNFYYSVLCIQSSVFLCEEELLKVCRAVCEDSRKKKPQE